MCGGSERGGVGGRVGRDTVEVVALFADVVGIGAQGGVDLGGVGALGFDEGVVGGEAAGGEGVLDGTGVGDAGGTDVKRTLISAQENFRAACGPWVRAREVGRRVRKGRSARESIVSSGGWGLRGVRLGFYDFRTSGFLAVRCASSHGRLDSFIRAARSGSLRLYSTNSPSRPPQLYKVTRCSRCSHPPLSMSGRSRGMCGRHSLPGQWKYGLETALCNARSNLT